MATELTLCVVEVTETVVGTRFSATLRVFSPRGGTARADMQALPWALLRRVRAALHGPSCAKVRAESEVFPCPRAELSYMVPMLLTYEEMAAILVAAIATQGAPEAVSPEETTAYSADYDDAEIAGERRANCD